MSPVAAAQARERVGDRIHAGTLETAPFTDESFDVILLSHTFEHLFSPRETLTRIRQLLKPDGIVVLTVPNVGSLEARLFGRWWVAWDPPRHLYHFEKVTVGKLLQLAGFYVMQARTGVGSHFFMTSLERAGMHVFGRTLPARWVIERLIARPFCLVAGNLGYGTEITVYAAKARAGSPGDGSCF
jgi:SAM-dependent methyltransferase